MRTISGKWSWAGISQMFEGVSRGGTAGYELRDTSFIRYQAPRNQTMPAEPSAHGAVQMMMAFYAEILSRRKM
jgi:hypothetical protein